MANVLSCVSNISEMCNLHSMSDLNRNLIKLASSSDNLNINYDMSKHVTKADVVCLNLINTDFLLYDRNVVSSLC